jgi:hypothetical protein
MLPQLSGLPFWLALIPLTLLCLKTKKKGRGEGKNFLLYQARWVGSGKKPNSIGFWSVIQTIETDMHLTSPLVNPVYNWEMSEYPLAPLGGNAFLVPS